MSETLDDLYLTWLYAQIGSVKLKNPARTYWSLTRQLYTTEFVWIIPNDDNRVEDGRDLRYEFLAMSGIEIDDVDPYWLGLGCSFLEMLIGLSRRLSFEAEGEPRGWYQQLLHNLGLTQYNDIEYDRHSYAKEAIDDILHGVIFRTYSRNGAGGLFPLSHPEEDQREVEIWYQMSAYVLEQD